MLTPADGSTEDTEGVRSLNAFGGPIVATRQGTDAGKLKFALRGWA
jgi:hypothetical protein